VKNAELWETAKSVAGKAGLSSFVEEALERLITAKRQEPTGAERFDRPVRSMDDTDQAGRTKFQERLGFDGKCLADWGVLSVYLTNGGTFIVTDNLLDGEGSLYSYRTYGQLAELRNDRTIDALDKDEQSRLWDRICEALPPSVFTTWVD
jgi:hypothetical protein